MTQAQKHELAETLYRWASHKAKLFERGANYMHSMAFAESITHVMNVARWAHRQHLTLTGQQLCRFVLINRRHFYNVLPHPANPSYPHQAEILNQILNTCTNETQSAQPLSA